MSRGVPVGLAMPLFFAATGKGLLAHASIQKQEQIISAQSLETAEADQLMRELEAIRERGWGLVADEWVEVVTGISVAVRQGHGDTGL